MLPLDVFTNMSQLRQGGLFHVCKYSEGIMLGMGMIWGSEGCGAVLLCARESYGLRDPESNTRKDEFSLLEMTSQSEVSQEERRMSLPTNDGSKADIHRRT